MGLEEIKGYMLGIIFMIVLVTGGVIWMGTFSSNDSAIDNGEINQFNNTLNKAENITSSVNAIDNSIQSVSDKGGLGWFNVIFGSAFNGLKAIGQSLGFVKVAATDAGNMFNAPPAMITLSLLAITVIICFAIWAAIMRINA